MRLAGLSYSEIAKKLYITRQRVQQIFSLENNKYSPYRKYLKHNCEICGCEKDKYRKSGSLTVHHKNGNHKDNNPNNLATLCNQCHTEYEASVSQHPKRKKSKSVDWEGYIRIRRIRAYEAKYGEGSYPY